MDDEMELKSGENNRMRKRLAEMDMAMQDLYVSRKGNGDLQIEISSLKQDNERLLELLKSTTEYADYDDNSIMKAAGKSMTGGFSSSKGFSGTKTEKDLKKSKIDNDWIPTEAVRAIQRIKDTPEFNGMMTETAISRILYDMNAIWRAIMRKEVDAVKKRLTTQIADLKRQVVTKQAFDKEELMKEITRTKKELAFASKQLANTKVSGFADEKAIQDRYHDELANSIKIVETVGIQKKALEDENEELKSRISELIHEREDMRANTTKKIEDSNTFYSQQPYIPALNLHGKRGSEMSRKSQ